MTAKTLCINILHNVWLLKNFISSRRSFRVSLPIESSMSNGHVLKLLIHLIIQLLRFILRERIITQF